LPVYLQQPNPASALALVGSVSMSMDGIVIAAAGAKNAT
jgi:hypothetical protein